MKKQAVTLVEFWSAATCRRLESGVMPPHSKKAFTLVELLVVITIIVVLLSLLAPAMEKAIYQTELAVCGTRHRAVALGATSYAAENKRAYPYRLYNDTTAGLAMLIAAPPDYYDDRPKLRPYFAINATLNCPLIPKIDLEAATVAFSTFNLWFGFNYHRGAERWPGMRRLGNRLQYPDSPPISTPLLTGTRYMTPNNGLTVEATHPDKIGTYYLFPSTDPGTAVNRWRSDDTGHGPIDLNFSFADGSVELIKDVEIGNDERFGRVPGFTNSDGWDGNYEFIPKR